MLINESLAGQKVATEFGDIQFNENGETKDLTAEQAEKLAKLPGFELKEEPKAAPKKEAPAKEEKKAPTKKSSTAKK
ncbi:hypothetical protein [Phage f2b1]|nr:hypothetical protein [Phage f2b1]